MTTNRLPCPGKPELAPAELKFLVRRDRGESYKEIADSLHVSVNTLRTYQKRILVKTHAPTLAHAAYQLGGPRLAFSGL